VVLPEQDNLSNSAQYHWVTTPIFSPDTHTLAYVEFSSDQQEPYDRHSSIYTVKISGSGAQLRVGKPQLLATTTSQLVELGPWYNNQIVTFYADGTLYPLDVAEDDALMPSLLTLSDVMGTGHHAALAAIRSGSHPVVAASGYSLYYLWVLAGDGREMRPRFDPRHAWVQEGNGR